jgi:uncharacterized repeat protein (TIGR01451 family)
VRQPIRILMIILGVLPLALAGCDDDDSELKSVDPDGGPDLVVTKTVDLLENRTPHEGAMIRYLVGVRNDGTWDALGVVLRDSLPAQVSFVDAVAEPGAYDPQTHRWEIGTLPADSSGSLAITVEVKEATLGQVVSNTARVLTMVPEDDEPQDNVATALFAVLNDPPRAADDAYECEEGGELVVEAPGVLENDTDAENEPFRLILEPVSEPWHGTVDLYADGGFVYRNDGSEATVDSFRYEIRDEGGNSGTGLVRLGILPLNDPPEGVEDFYPVDEGGTVSGNVLDNDRDPEDEPLTAVLEDLPGHAASFDFALDGSFIYIHDGSEDLIDTFTYRANDGENLSDPVTVTLSVSVDNDPPVVSGIPDQFIDEGDDFAEIELDLYAEDPDNDIADLAWTSSGAEELTVDIDPVTHRCTVTIPDPDWFGGELISFRVTDPFGAWDEDNVLFQVRPVNDPPAIQAIPDQQVAEGGSFTVLILDMFVHDPDDPDVNLQWQAEGGGPYTVEIDADRRLTVEQPYADWFGQASLTLTVTDPGGLEDDQLVSFTVTPVNDAPVCVNLPNQEIEPGGSFLPILLDSVVSDVDNADEDMIWTFSGQGDLEVAIDSARVATVSVPDADWTGQVTIVFRATDPSGAWDETDAIFTVLDGAPAR